MHALFVAPGYFRNTTLPQPGSKPPDLRKPAPEPDDPVPEVGKIRIKVTRDDIRQGLRGNSEYCPVARATTRALGFTRLGLVTVGGTTISRLSAGPDMPLPAHVTARIVAYDFLRIMVPFTFTVKVPR